MSLKLHSVLMTLVLIGSLFIGQRGKTTANQVERKELNDCKYTLDLLAYSHTCVVKDVTLTLRTHQRYSQEALTLVSIV